MDLEIALYINDERFTLKTSVAKTKYFFKSLQDSFVSVEHEVKFPDVLKTSENTCI